MEEEDEQIKSLNAQLVEMCLVKGDLISLPCNDCTVSCHAVQGSATEARMNRTPTAQYQTLQHRQRAATSWKRFVAELCEGPRKRKGDKLSATIEFET